MTELRETLRELSAEQVLSSRLLKRALKAESKLDAVRPYLRHAHDCVLSGDPYVKDMFSCTCGLQAILEKTDE